jgi:ATP-dependent DNA helicase UvrD/PcrA
LAALAARLGRRDLTHNWRSTTVICTVAATLRGDPARRIPDTAVADHHDAPHPVLVYTGRDRDAITADFVAYAAKLDINPGACLVLAHALATLPKTYTGAATPPSSNAGALAWAIGIIIEYPTAPPRVRNRANDILARTVLRWWYTESDDHTPAQILVARDIDPAGFERLLHRVATAMPPLDQPMSTWVPAAVAVLNQHPPASGAARTRNRLICTAGHATRAARAVTGLPSAPAAGARPRLSTVHQVKGGQAEAVLLFIPPGTGTDRAMAAWLSGTVRDPEIAEALRVLYVGVTRARHLLGLAIPHTDQDRLLAHLHRHSIRTELR